MMFMSRKNKLIYWISTIWLSFGMVSTGVFQIIQYEEAIENLLKMGIPMYIIITVGVWKILGVIFILIPKFKLIKEWAYAGFIFLTTGAIFSHFAVGDELFNFFGPTLLLVLTIISWYFRPEDRKIKISLTE